MAPSEGDCIRGGVDRGGQGCAPIGAGAERVHPRASRGVSPPAPGPTAPSPRARRPACAPPAAVSRGGEKARCRVASSFVPLLQFRHPPFAEHRVRPTRSPAPKEGRWREQNRGCQEGGGAAGREHREPTGSALCTLSGRAGGPATCAGGRQLLPGLGHPEPPSRPEGGTGSSGPGGLVFPSRASLERSAGAPGVSRVGGHPIRPLAAPGTRQEPRPPPPRNELSTAALGAARGHARICPGGSELGGRPLLGGMEGRWNQATVRFGNFPWIHVFHIPRGLLHRRDD